MAEGSATCPTFQALVDYVADHWMESKHYKVAHKTLSNRWDRSHSLNAAIKLMGSYGVTLSEAEQEQLAQLEESKQIEQLVMKMPSQNSEQFGNFFRQLQLLVSTAAKVRQCLEAGNTPGVEAALADADRTGIAPYILKMAIVQAGSEVGTIKSEYAVWARDMDQRMAKIIRGQEDAMSAQKKLAVAQATLNSFQAGQNDKAKKVLANLAAGSDKGLISTCFTAWHGVITRDKKEKEIREEYEERIETAEKRLLDLKTEHLKGARGIMGKRIADLEHQMKHEILHTWKTELVDNKRTADDVANIKALENRLAGVQKSQKENTARVMHRMNAGNDTALCTTVWQSWFAYHLDYQKDKEMEDRVKASEQKVAEFMKKQGASAKSVLAAAGSGSESALITTCWQAWVQMMTEAKQEAEMNELIMGAGDKFKMISGRGKENGKTALEKASYHVNVMYMIRHLVVWKLETREKKALRFFESKIAKKRQQLLGVQEMFRQFASKLESSFKGSQDSIRDAKSRSLSKGDGSVSLPDINQKPTSGQRNSGRSANIQGAYPGESPATQPRAAYVA